MIFSQFIPVDSKSVTITNQEKLHKIMGLIIDKLYNNPELLNLTTHKDEAYQSHEVNNMKPELDRIYQSVFKSLYEFYKFLYITALHGELKINYLIVSNMVLKNYRTGYKPQYNTLLNEVGIEAIKNKTEVSITSSDDGLLQSLKILAEKVPVNINQWTPYALANFACCAYKNDFNYLLERADTVNNLNGLLLDMQENALAKGYKQSIRCNMGATGFDFNISLKNTIGGFLIGYNPRKYKPFYFGTENGIGEKTMIEDFNNLDKELQEHFIKVCKICNSCLICTKGGKNKIFASNVIHNGKEYNLCPSYPRHSWESIDEHLMNVLYKYHDAQEKYGVDWKKK